MAKEAIVGKETLFVVKNKNTREYVADDYMAIIGASTSRTLTGQGLGIKFVGIRAAIDGIRFARASHDSDGPYLAWYEIEDYDLDGDERKRAVLAVQRPGGTTRRALDIDTNFVMSAWSNHMLGNDYPTAREIILDAVDEDKDFVIEEASGMEYSPPGQTWTYFEKTKNLASLMRRPGYFFVRGDQVAWIDGTIGVTPSATLNEARMFVTAGEVPTLAYAAWSSGIHAQDAVPDAAFSYVLRETESDKWASMPKRLVEDVAKAHKQVCEALMKCKDADVLGKVFRNVINGGWETGLPWKTYDYYWNKDTAKKALSKATGARPVHPNDNDAYFETAERLGYDPVEVPSWMYEVAKFSGYRTVANMLNIREAGEIRIVPATAEQRRIVRGALEFLEAVYPWTDWRNGHVFSSLEADHQPSVHVMSGVDTIALNFGLGLNEQSAAKLIVHETAHHGLGVNSANDNWHPERFSEALLDLMWPPEVGS